MVGWRAPAALGAVALLVAALAFARLTLGPWDMVYNPLGAGLVEGWPVGWEIVYYLVHVPTFLGDALPTHTISDVHYRALVPLQVASLLSVWLGSVYWSFALVELSFWTLAVVATYHLARRLGVGELTARIAALLTLASPLFASAMWQHVLHVAEFATMPIGLWAGVVLIDEERRRARLALALGGLLVLLSLTYNYQWITLPILLALLRTSRLQTWREVLAILAGAVGVYGAVTAMARLVLILGQLDPLTNPGAEHMQAVAEPAQLLAARWADFRSNLDLRVLLPRVDHLTTTAKAYHPIVFGVAIGGVLLCPPRVRWLALIGSLAALYSYMLYPAPWTAMSAYPLLYIGAGAGCSAVGRAAGRLLLWRREDRVMQMLTAIFATSTACGLAALTNLDLVGRYGFALAWWRLFFVPGVY